MSHKILPFHLEPMKSGDIPQVVNLEQISFSRHWSPRDYYYELQQNYLAHYFVLRTSLPPAKQPTDQPLTLVGTGGFWLMAGEAHLSTLAIHPAWRRLGLGEWLLMALLEKAQTLGATVVTLEVRPSNQAAILLYQKYAFQEVGRRPHYYHDTGEDALIFTTPPLISPDYQTMLGQRKAALNLRFLYRTLLMKG
ncbi:MAG: ribosomal protein S18-alanine N-acetyltransferase [Anaerolineae bacterium]|nr:ribosomal protein S18-alanine N-acetyltransferase [Anaerolineae bacterium]